MDVRWIAYIGSGVLAAVSLVPTGVWRTPEPKASVRTPRAAASAPDPVLVDVERRTARLRTFATEAPPPRAPGRNPFRFGESRLRPKASPSPRIAPVDTTPQAAPAPVEPRLELVGMAERREGDGIVRTAILAGFGDVHLVRVGDRVAGRFTVLSIGADAVELQDEVAQSVLRLALH
jgi:hypothetical protein